ncbi:MAG TPA: hypothetical protein VNU70_13770 [Puia sp.]|jgi:hypothetical protein|nr:hypothetical protein [Puia sp.]
MKKWLLSVLIPGMLWVSSCKKSGSSNNNPTTNNAYLSSVVSLQPQTRVIDSFYYDTAHRMTRITQYQYDSSQGFPTAGAWSAYFAYPAGAGTTPNSYLYVVGGSVDIHALTYDGQGRITRDTSVSGTGFVAYYSYPNGNIATTVLFDGTPMNNQVDTLFIGNGNVNSMRIYYPNNAGTADSLAGTVNFGFTSLTNPAYHATQTNSIGPLLYILQVDGYGSSVDPISEHAFNSVSGSGYGLPAGVTIHYNQTTDAQGRLTLLSSSLGPVAGSIAFTYY